MNSSVLDIFHPDALLAVEILCLLIALAFVVSGRVSVRVARTLTLIGLAALLSVCLRYGVLLVEQDQFEVALVRGWLLPRNMPGAIQVGVLFGRAGFVVSSLAALLGVSFVLASSAASSARSGGNSVRFERELAAVLLGTLGVQLSWLSVSVWQALAGVGLAVLGGFFALGARWREEEEATLSVRFALERVAPLALALAGAASLASHSVSLVFDAAAKPGMVGGGAALLLVGLMMLVPQTPLLGSLIAPSRERPASRTLFVQVLPALAVCGTFFHLARTYQSPLFSVVASILVLSAVLTGVVGLAQADWKRALGPWVSAGVSLSVAAFLSADPGVGVAMLFPAVVAPLLVAFLSDETIKVVPRWAAASVGLLATAWPGSVGIAGRARWWWAAHESGSGALLLVFVSEVVCALLAWRLVWALVRGPSDQNGSAATAGIWTRMGVGAVAIPLVGVLWVGSFTGGAWFDDQLFGSFLGSLFAPVAKMSSDAQQTTAFYHGTVLVLGAALGFWLSGTSEGDRWLLLRARFPRLSGFLESAYASEALLRHARVLLVRTAGLFSRVFEQGLWRKLFPAAAEFFGGRVAPSLGRVDARLRSRVGSGLSRLVALPGLGLQAIQSGDIQWYLFFALTVGIGFILIF